jgi:hypothetical protein
MRNVLRIVGTVVLVLAILTLLVDEGFVAAGMIVVYLVAIVGFIGLLVITVQKLRRG